MALVSLPDGRNALDVDAARSRAREHRRHAARLDAAAAELEEYADSLAAALEALSPI